MLNIRILGALLAGVLGLSATPSHAGIAGDLLHKAAGAASAWGATPQVLPAPRGQQLEVAFSPNEGAEDLVVKVIDSSHQSIRLMAYSFTSAPVVKALLEAKHRGVDVAVVVDYAQNLGGSDNGKKESRGRAKARTALNALVNAGIRVRTTSAFHIHHDKTIIVDNQHVETGSFNYSAEAAKGNSENALVVWNNRDLAAAYLKHFERNWNSGDTYSERY